MLVFLACSAAKLDILCSTSTMPNCFNSFVYAQDIHPSGLCKWSAALLY